MLRISVLVAIFCLPLLGTPGRAEQPEAATAAAGGGCLDWPVALLTAKKTAPEAALVQMMDGKAASDFLDILNAVPPRSHITGDHVAIFFVPDADALMVVAGGHDCATAIFELSRSAVEQIVGREA